MIQHGVYFYHISFSANDGERNWKVVLIRHGSQLEPVKSESTEAQETIGETKAREKIEKEERKI